MGHRASRIFVAALVLLAALALGRSVPQASAAACQTFAETGKTVCDPFLTYWNTHGGLAQQGLPLTDEFTEVSPTDGKPYTVQYFERARFEKHPENKAPYDVLLGLLGREQVLAKYPGGTPAGLPGRPIGSPCVDFPETGKQVCGVFIIYWDGHGGLAQQGLPLTDLFMETNPTDGKQYPTQYFERARFEYHAEFVGSPNVVLLGLLGREQLQAKYPNGVPGGGTPPPAPEPKGCGPLPSALSVGATFTDPKGRFTARYPSDWKQRVEGDGNVSVVAPSGAGVSLVSADAPGRQLEEYKDQILSQVQEPVATNGYFEQLCLDKVTVGQYPGYRLRFLHNRIDGGSPQREEINRIFFLANGRSYTANGFLEPNDPILVLIESIAASIVPKP